MDWLQVRLARPQGGLRRRADRLTEPKFRERERLITVEQYSEYFYLCTVKCHEVVIVQALKIAEGCTCTVGIVVNQLEG